MTRTASGHLEYRKGKRGYTTIYTRVRLPDGRRVNRALGKLRKERSKPPAGWFTKRSAPTRLREILADLGRAQDDAELQEVLVSLGWAKEDEQQNRGEFADAVEAWLTFVETDRKRRRATVRDYEQLGRFLVDEFGADTAVADVTTERVEEYRSRMVAEGRLSARSINKRLVALHAVLGVAGITPNPVAGVKRQPLPKRKLPNFYEPEEVWAIVRAADDETDAAAVALGAFAGLRMAEVMGLRWRDVDFAADTIRVVQTYSGGLVEPTKSGEPRAVPMAPDLAALLARLSQRERFTDPDDPVCPAMDGRHQDDSGFRKRYYGAARRAGLRRLRFHDLRHCFGSVAIREATLVEVSEWMGHADLKTTAIYLHFKPRAEAAKRLGSAFSPQGSASPPVVGLEPDAAGGSSPAVSREEAA